MERGIIQTQPERGSDRLASQANLTWMAQEVREIKLDVPEEVANHLKHLITCLLIAWISFCTSKMWLIDGRRSFTLLISSLSYFSAYWVQNVFGHHPPPSEKSKLQKLEAALVDQILTAADTWSATWIATWGGVYSIWSFLRHDPTEISPKMGKISNS